MVCACIDIGSNTTRVLVSEAREGRLAEILQQREFTRIGKDLRARRRISEAKIEQVAEVVAAQLRLAESVGAATTRVVATAAIRDATNRADLLTAVQERCGVVVHVLDGVEEARLAFIGATRTLGVDLPGEVAVVDVGGGSTEIAVGTVPDGAHWSASFRIGSGAMADAYLRSDPPSAAELHAIREHAAGVFEGLEVPRAEVAVAVGGSATSLRRLIGGVLDPESLQRGLRVLSAEPAADVARRFTLDAERVKLLPAGLLVLEAASHRLGLPLTIGRGGIREGVILELAHGDQPFH